MNRLAAFVLVAACALAHARTAGAEVLWRGDFETADTSQWNELVGMVAQRLSIVEDEAVQGRYAARIEVHQGDTSQSGLTRVEVGHHPPTETFEGSERWYAWSMMIPEDAPFGDSWHLVTYWEAEVLWTVAVSLRIYGGHELRFATYVPEEQVHWTSTFTPGAWHDFVLHVVWSPDPSEGLVELWHDGEQVVDPLHVATMHELQGGDAAPNFMHQGILRDDEIQQTEVLYLDGTIEATAREDVMPSDPEPTGTDGGETSSGGDDSTSDGSETGVGETSSSAPSSDASGDGVGTTAAEGGEASGDAQGGGSTPSDAAGRGGGCRLASAAPSSALLVLPLLLVRRRRRVRSSPAQWGGAT